MEFRDQEKDLDTPNSMNYSPHQLNPELSTKQQPSLSMGSTLPERRRHEPSPLDITIGSSQTLENCLPQHQQHQLHFQHQHSHNNSQTGLAEVQENTIVPTSSNSRTLQARQLQRSNSSNSGNTTIRYRECLKNHAASTGGHVLDGCGEFMPNGEEGTPEAFRCAACDCHRNFHRKEIDGDPQTGTNYYYAHNLGRNNNSSHRTTILHAQPPVTMPPQHHHLMYSHSHARGLATSPSTGPPAPIMMAFGGHSGGAPAESSSEDLNIYGGTQTAARQSFSSSKKRFRTKFTQDQKDRMHEFAQKLGWKIQKQDHEEVQQFCSEVGIKRQVFKVWMHNNKQAMKKKPM